MVCKNGSPFQFRVVHCILTGYDGDFPLVIPDQGNLGVNRDAPVIEACGNHLKRLRAHHPDTVIKYYPERKDFPFADLVLQLLDTFLAERVGGHKDMCRARLFDQVADQANQVKITPAVKVVFPSVFKLTD